MFGKKGKSAFDASVIYGPDPDHKIEYNQMISKIAEQGKKSQGTTFHQIMDRACGEDFVRHFFTQNIDGIERRYPSLEKRTWFGHGEAGKMICSLCSTKLTLDIGAFQTGVAPRCRECALRSRARVEQGKRGSAIGENQPWVLLYGQPANESMADLETQTADWLQHVASHPGSGLLVTGTTLGILPLRKQVKAIAANLKAKGKPVVLIDPGKLSSSTDEIASIRVEADCQRFAEKLGHVMDMLQEWMRLGQV